VIRTREPAPAAGRYQRFLDGDDIGVPQERDGGQVVTNLRVLDTALQVVGHQP